MALACRAFNQNERGSLLEDDVVVYLKLRRRSIFQTVKLHVDWMVRAEITQDAGIYPHLGLRILHVYQVISNINGHVQTRAVLQIQTEILEVSSFRPQALETFDEQLKCLQEFQGNSLWVRAF